RVVDEEAPIAGPVARELIGGGADEQARLAAAVRRFLIEIEHAPRGGSEHDPAAIRRPERRSLVRRVEGQPRPGFPPEVEKPNVRMDLRLLSDRDRDLLSVGREARAAVVPGLPNRSEPPP